MGVAVAATALGDTEGSVFPVTGIPGGGLEEREQLTVNREMPKDRAMTLFMIFLKRK
jgi:hypothetical protein